MNKIAILYQSEPPPMKDGILKPMKPGGYSDSGADIANELIANNLPVVTPVKKPNPSEDKDWVFPDSKIGIEDALSNGANIFWLNTVIYKNHPIEYFFDRGIQIIGQTPSSVDKFDDKMFTNNLLKSNDIPIPKSELITKDKLLNQSLDINFPLVLKPIRGRGSQGVVKIDNQKELINKADTLFSENKFGDTLYVEQYLSGQEITITVMPKGNYLINNQDKSFMNHWCLPAVKRFNHDNGIAPYNGLVAVMENSEVLEEHELNSKHIQDVYRHCTKAAELIGIKAPIRIDCRSDSTGTYYLFDLNMKPNMTGPSRPQRINQDSLSLLAARKIGWNYFDLLNNMVNQKWSPSM